MFSKVKELVSKLLNKEEPEVPPEETTEELCCKGVVHITYRGLADDRMYISYNRKWSEVKFFRQNNLRVFCADCRTRIYDSSTTDD